MSNKKLKFFKIFLQNHLIFRNFLFIIGSDRETKELKGTKRKERRKLTWLSFRAKN